MNITIHERPGVYSSYDISNVISGKDTGKTVGIVAKSTGGEAGTRSFFARYEEAAALYGAGDALTELVRLLFLNGASAVHAIPVSEDAQYEAAFSKLSLVEGIAVVTSDTSLSAPMQALCQSVIDASKERRERVAVLPGVGSVSELVALAELLNHERMILTGAVYEDAEDAAKFAAAAAGAVAGLSDPAVPLGGARLAGVPSFSKNYSDSELDLLVAGGVTALESVSGTVFVIRGITTRTKTGDALDATWREVSTILILDDVLPGLRQSLRAQFARSKNTAQTRGAVRSHVVLELEKKLARQIITSYGDIKVSRHPEDPTICVAEISFAVAHGMNQIWVTAHITV